MNFFIKSHFHSIIISPLLPLMVFFIGGIVWPISSLPFSMTAISIFLFFFIYIFHNNASRSSFFYAAFYIAIATTGSLLYKKEINNYNDFYTFAQNNTLEITGIIEDINASVLCNKPVTIVTLNAQSAKNHLITKNVNKKIVLYGSYDQTLSVGDRVTFFNVHCKKPADEHLILYQIREGVIATVFSTLPYTIADHPSFSIKRWIFDTKQAIVMSCKQKLSSQTFLLFSSLFLGNRHIVKNSLESINEQFKRWGIYHFLARSGLHLALFIFMWCSIFKYIPLTFNIKNIFFIFLILLYDVFSWSSVPFARSLLLFCCNKVCFLTKASYNLLHYLTLICFCFLLYCPCYLFFLDFQLTFGITFILAWFNQLYKQYTYEQYTSKTLNY